MSDAKQLTILITGCSPGGMGAELAIAFHKAGHHVYATARNPSKLESLTAQGIQTLTLDVTSATSIESAVSAFTFSLPDGKGLDMLINNAGSIFTMPLMDTSLDAAKQLFDLNVWAQVAVTQAFLPLLLKSTNATSTTGHQPMIVNHTSVGAVMPVPFQGVYNASKAAFAMLSDTMRLELAAFGIRVIELKTAVVSTNIITNLNTNAEPLPKGSIYEPAREVVEKSMSQEAAVGMGIPAEQWAAEVSTLLLGNNPPAVIWKGKGALITRMVGILPFGLFERTLKKVTKLDVVEDIIKESRKQAS